MTNLHDAPPDPAPETAEPPPQIDPPLDARALSALLERVVDVNSAPRSLDAFADQLAGLVAARFERRWPGARVEVLRPCGDARIVMMD